MKPHSYKSPQKEKRKRGDNWLEDDKALLQELIRKNVTWIENKNTDTQTNKEKQSAWLDVAENFNRICIGSQRSVDQLKSQWCALKVQTRKTVRYRQMEIRATSGDCTPPQDEAVSENDISVWLPAATGTVDDSRNFSRNFNGELSDDEAASFVDIKQKVEIFDDEPPPEIEHEEVEVPPETVKELKQTFTSKKKKKSPKQQAPRYDSKIKEIADVDIKCRLELHAIQVEKEQLIIENERKRSKILDLKYDLIKAKLLKEVGALNL